ncbi:CAMK family protein kinase [Tritrichomonas foetus]|uniref:CAMK family protein kinase n=1 Tax=Tritrichomonas foetus TaxID=1144522 RepID=A0A1J4KP70_9EUKA|nr:CAMK family protein kinase [Tritrichomonas foetus]|eukprot:OHT12898.1 CAMK family protein kinase [Tritrichomonas foetus]
MTIIDTYTQIIINYRLIDLPMQNFKTPEGYEFIKNLSQGFFSRSALVKSNLGELFVCKRISKKLIDDVQAFIERLDHISTLNSPFIVSYNLIKEDEEDIILIRKFIEGDSLIDSALEKYEIDQNNAYAMWKIVIRTFAHLHRHHIISTYILPSNIFVLNSNSILITDTLPLSLKINIQNRTPNLLQVGFLPPEAFGAKPMNEASDTWSLGVLLHYMISRSLPFRTKNLCTIAEEILHCEVTINPSLPLDIQGIIKTLLHNTNEKSLILEKLVVDRISASRSQSLPLALPRISGLNARPTLLKQIPKIVSLNPSKPPTLLSLCSRSNESQRENAILTVRARAGYHFHPAHNPLSV